MSDQVDRGQSTVRVAVEALDAGGASAREDVIAVEEPMEIRVQTGEGKARRTRSVSVTMRTPGHDFELAVGFLFGEGLLEGRAALESVAFCGPPAPGKPHSNIVRVELRGEVELDLVKLQRNFYSTSSCGICGKASLDALDFEGYVTPARDVPRVRAETIHAMPGALREAQAVFAQTGGLHAAGLFSADGELLACREDVGRHNAVDKLIGAQVLAERTPLSGHVLMVSGRVSFEILQKALSAGVPFIVAVGAPSSLAVEMAERFGMTLVGFARDGRFNVYAGAERVLRSRD
jgi:FdhD protein